MEQRSAFLFTLYDADDSDAISLRELGNAHREVAIGCALDRGQHLRGEHLRDLDGVALELVEIPALLDPAHHVRIRAERGRERRQYR